METIKFNEGLQSIGDHAFYNCKSLEFFEAPTTLLTINQYAFAECIGLRMLYLNDNLKTLSAYAFAGCDGLLSVIINDNLTVLSNKTFTDCANLTAAEIPSTVISYGVDCFYNCPKLTIYCYENSSAHLALEGSSYSYYLLDGHTHTYEKYIETTATCFRKGTEINTCTDCGYNYIGLIDMLGHEYERVEVAPTCTEYGCIRFVCLDCGEFYEENIVEPTGHKETYFETIDPTFEADGCIRERCKECSTVISETVILKLVYGDADRDGEINATDLTIFRKALFNKAELDEYQQQVVDANNDGAFDVRDIVWLKRYLIEK